jgi:hypothetical protein
VRQQKHFGKLPCAAGERAVRAHNEDELPVGIVARKRSAQKRSADAKGANRSEHKTSCSRAVLSSRH